MSSHMEGEIVTLEEMDKELLDKLKKAGIERILLCVQCGTCSASCPSGRITAFKTRQLMRKALLGLKEVLESQDLWLCTTCYTCLERCPRKIETVPVIIALRNMAFEAGCVIPRHRDVATMFARYGHAVPINEENQKKRESLGLSRIPPTVHSSEKALKELHFLVHETGFDAKLGIKFEEEKP